MGTTALTILRFRTRGRRVGNIRGIHTHFPVRSDLFHQWPLFGDISVNFAVHTRVLRHHIQCIGARGRTWFRLFAFRYHPFRHFHCSHILPVNECSPGTVVIHSLEAREIPLTHLCVLKSRAELCIRSLVGKVSQKTVAHLVLNAYAIKYSPVNPNSGVSTRGAYLVPWADFYRFVKPSKHSGTLLNINYRTVPVSYF